MKLILFDFDGVLVDTLLISFSISAEMDDKLSLEEYKSFFHGNIYDAIKSGRGRDSYRPDYYEQYSARTRELRVPDELKKVLNKLSLSDTLVIVSSTPASLINEILDRDGVAAYFEDIYGREIHTSKVVKIKMLLEKYKIAPEGAVYITDTVGDIMEARECGVKSIAVTWGFHDEATLQKAKPAKIVSNPEDLIKSIEEISNE
jgi:phosphoglycolate phosphatase